MKQSALWILSGTLPMAVFAADLDTLKSDGALSYFSSFDSLNPKMESEAGQGVWNPSLDAVYVPTDAAGKDAALVMGSGLWSNGQTVLTAEDREWTMVFSACPGTIPHGVLLAFGTGAEPGLALRRGEVPGSLEVTVGKNVAEPLLKGIPAGETSDFSYHAYALTYREGTLELFADGVSAGSAPADGAAVILKPYQWATRKDGLLPGETKSVGGGAAVRCFGVWKRVLTAEEMSAAAMLPQPEAMRALNFRVPEAMKAPTRGRWLMTEVKTELEHVSGAQQSADGRLQNVAEVVATLHNDYTDKVYGVESGDCAHTKYGEVQERDVWLMVSGGCPGRVIGGRDNNWTGKKATMLKGSLVTELNGTVRALYTAGALTGGSNGSDPNHPDGYPFVGNSRVTVDGGARAVGSLVGRSVVQHGRPITEDVGDSGVYVYALQDESLPEKESTGYKPPAMMGTLGFGWIVGGSAVADTRKNGVAQKGNTSVTVVLDEADTEGNEHPQFVKNIVGGSYASMVCRNVKLPIDGHTSVSVKAPDTVVFTSNVIGGTHAQGVADGDSAVSGDTTVVLEGGTYTGAVYAGGVGNGASVRGTARLILKGGVFTCVMEAAGEGASVTDSELVAEMPETDLSRTKSLGGFRTLTMNGDVTLGTHRLPETLLNPQGEQRTLSLKLSEDDLLESRIAVGRLAPGSVSLPENLRVQIEGMPADWVPRIDSDTGAFSYGVAAKENVWSEPESEELRMGLRPQLWSDGFPNFVGRDGAVFDSPAVPKTPVSLWLTEEIRAGAVTVKTGADVLLRGNGTLSAESLTVAGRLDLSPREAPPAEGFPYLRLQLLERRKTNGYPGMGLEEIRLMQDGKRCADKLNDLADLTAKTNHPNAKVKPSNLGDGLGAESKNGSSKWFLGSEHMGDKTRMTLCYTDVWVDIAGKNGQNLPHDTYVLETADVLDRNPKRWSWLGSRDGQTWQVLDYQSLTDEQAGAMGKYKAHSYPLLPAGAPTVKGDAVVSGVLAGSGCIDGRAEFLDGSVLELPEGTEAPTVTGTVSGTVKLQLPASWNGSSRKLLTAPENPKLTWVLPQAATEAGMDKVTYRNGAYWLLSESELTVTPELTAGTTAAFSELRWSAGGTPMTYAQLKALSGVGLKMKLTLPPGETVLTADDPLVLEAVQLGGRPDSTLTLNGRQLTVKQLLIGGGPTVLAATGSLQASEVRMQGATLSVDQQENGWMPKLTGVGTYIKRGQATLQADAAQAPSARFRLIVDSGMLVLHSRAADKAAYEEAYDITVRDGATLMIGANGRPNIGLTNPETKLILEGGARLTLHNGSSSVAEYGKMPFSILVRNATEKPAVIGGGTGGDNARLEGAIVGEPTDDGAVQQLHLAVANSHWLNPWTVAGKISGNLALTVAWPKVLFEGTEPYTHTGGTAFSGSVTLSAPERFVQSDLTVNPSAVLTVPEGTALTVGAGKTLTCFGKIAGRTVFEDGAALDISKGWQMLQFAPDAIAWNGLWQLRVSKKQVDSDRIIVGGAATKPPASYAVYADGVLSPETVLQNRGKGLALAVRKPADFPLPPEAEAQLPAEAKERLSALVASVTGAGGQPLGGVSKIEAGPNSAGSEAVGALAVFEGVAAVAEDPEHPGLASVSVSYDFGITDMRFAGGTLYVAASVRTLKDGEVQPAAYAAGTVCRLLAVKDGAEPSEVSGQAELNADERKAHFGADAPTQGVRYLKFPLDTAAPGMNFLVRVTAP